MRTRETRKCHLQVEPLEGRFALGGGGAVLPPTATPHGFSLTDMSRETALFNTSNNDKAKLPNTPFQVLYFDPTTVRATPPPDVVETGSNKFPVSPGTLFYVPLLTVDDSPPIIGTFPTTASDAASYTFSPKQVGVRGTEIIVDGKSTPIGAAYVVGPVQTPLGDGGTHIITLGAFLSPMSVGTHTVEIKGEAAGQAFQQANPGIKSLSFDFTYMVQVG